MLELVEELFRREVLALQGADELQRVLVGDHVGRRRGEPAEQVVHDGPLLLVALDREVGHAVGGVGDDLGGGGAAEAFRVERLLEQRVEGRGDEKVEVGDLRQLAQRGRHAEIGLAQDRAQPGVGFLASAPRGEIPAHDVVQGAGLRQLAEVDGEFRRQLFRQPVVEQPGAGVGLHAQELRAHDRYHPAFLDVVEQVLPAIVIQGGQTGGGVGVGRDHGRVRLPRIGRGGVARPRAAWDRCKRNAAVETFEVHDGGGAVQPAIVRLRGDVPPGRGPKHVCVFPALGDADARDVWFFGHEDGRTGETPPSPRTAARPWGLPRGKRWD